MLIIHLKYFITAYFANAEWGRKKISSTSMYRNHLKLVLKGLVVMWVGNYRVPTLRTSIPCILSTSLVTFASPCCFCMILSELPPALCPLLHQCFSPRRGCRLLSGWLCLSQENVSSGVIPSDDCGVSGMMVNEAKLLLCRCCPPKRLTRPPRHYITDVSHLTYTVLCCWAVRSSKMRL